MYTFYDREMKIRRVIGVALLLVAVAVIFITYSENERIRSGFDTARKTPIFTSNQIDPEAFSTVDTTYVYAHQKLLIQNAEKKEEDQSPCLIVKFADGDIWKLVYSEGEELMVSVHDGPITVTKSRNPEGEIQFLNFACGCENIGPSIFFYGSLAIGAVIIPIGLFLTLKKNSIKTE
jgi:multisubunit Na+/H+ antiporter MnhC subunit